MIIRRKQPADTPGCAALLRTTHHHDGYPVYLHGDFEDFVTTPTERAAWVAVAPGADGTDSTKVVAGHVALHEAEGDPTAEVAGRTHGLRPDQLVVVARLAVDPQFRGRGLARTLLATATSAAQDWGRRPVLDVQFDAQSAIRLYEAVGWTRIGSTQIPLVGHPPLPVWVYLAPD